MSKRPFNLAPAERSEDDIHEDIARTLALLIGEPGVANRLGVMWWSVEHRNAASAKEGARRRKRGVVAGLPDLWVLWRGGLIPIELKRPGYAPSDVRASQRRFHAAMATCGVKPWIGTSVDDVLGILNAEGVPLLGRVLAGGAVLADMERAA